MCPNPTWIVEFLLKHPLAIEETEMPTSMVIRTCEAEIEDSWMRKVTVVALSMADSELDFVKRIHVNITKTVSYGVSDLDDSALDYGRYGLNDGDRGRRRAADEI